VAAKKPKKAPRKETLTMGFPTKKKAPEKVVERKPVQRTGRSPQIKRTFEVG
jgi:hypothetical protein